MTMTLEEIAALRKLADSNFATAAALNKLLPPFEQLRRDLYDIKNAREIDNAGDRAFLQSLSEGDRSLIQELNKTLAVVLENVRIAQGDVKQLSKDFTGTHALQQDNRSTAERIIDRLERAPTSTKLWMFALVLVVVCGFGLHLILAALGIGG
jgi:hypothetical protein